MCVSIEKCDACTHACTRTAWSKLDAMNASNEELQWARRKLRRIVRRALINAAITTMCLELLEGLE
jgi:hypothetical protein